MSAGDPELDALLAPLRDGPIALSSSAEAEARKQRLLPALRAEVAIAPERARRRRTVRRTTLALSGAFGMSAAAAVAIFALRGADRDVSTAELRVEPLGARGLTFVDDRGMPAAIGAVAAITAPGEIVASPAAWSRVSTARGVQVDLAPRTRLRVTAVKPQPRRSGLRLEQGEVHCRVPRLGPSEQFSIATPGANVIVHGTVFSVRVLAPDASGQRATCVRVDEGLVEVQHGTGSVRLGPGAQWGCEQPTTAGPIAVVRTPEREPERARVEARPSRARSAAAARKQRRAAMRLPDGTLDEENQLLAAALGAERRQDHARARALFGALLERHPRSPLVPEARAGLERTR